MRTASIIRAMNKLPKALLFALMMEAVRTSETSVNFIVTIWRNIPEDSELVIFLKQHSACQFALCCLCLSVCLSQNPMLES
jgi:hypothetical protein